MRNLTQLYLYSAALVILSLITFISSASYMKVKSLQFEAPSNLAISADVQLTAEAIAVDPLSRTIVMDWYPVLTSQNRSNTTPVVRDIYLSSLVMDRTSATWSPAPPFLPVFTLNSSIYCLDLLETPFPSFRTITKLLAQQNSILQVNDERSTLQNYPFDLYTAPFSFWTRNLDTGATMALNVTRSFGTVVNFEISLLNSLVLLDAAGNSRLQFALRVERSRAAKTFVVMVAVTNWLVATAFLIICAATLVYRPHVIYTEMFVVPVGALFAFTSIRANLPGAPLGFGTTIDMYSILPVLVIMSLCSFILLLVILYRRIKQVGFNDESVLGIRKLNNGNNNNLNSSTPTPQVTNQGNSEQSSIHESTLEPGIDKGNSATQC